MNELTVSASDRETIFGLAAAGLEDSPDRARDGSEARNDSSVPSGNARHRKTAHSEQAPADPSALGTETPIEVKSIAEAHGAEVCAVRSTRILSGMLVRDGQRKVIAFAEAMPRFGSVTRSRTNLGTC